MKRLALIVVGVAALASFKVTAQSPATHTAPTFAKDVAPIMFNKCANCHRPGEVAPMSLLSYAAARPYARSIATRVSQGTMPPWHADPAHGEFVNARTLTPGEKETILKWVSAGAPEGNAADLPPQPVYPDGWNIGKPDAVFALTEDYPVPASGTMASAEASMVSAARSSGSSEWMLVLPQARAIIWHSMVSVCRKL